MSALAQNAESQELSDALEKLGQEAARLQTVIDTVPSFLWTSLPDGSKEYLNKRWYEYTGLSSEHSAIFWCSFSCRVKYKFVCMEIAYPTTWSSSLVRGLQVLRYELRHGG
jgi:PAS domain-containing protein